MLSAFESNVFAALSHHARGACAAADDRANRSTFAAAGDSADDRADTGSRAHFRRIVFRRVAAFDAAFGINLRRVIAERRDLEQFGRKCGRAMVRRTDLIERELQCDSQSNGFGQTLIAVRQHL